MIAFVSIAQVILGERNPTPHNAVMTSHEKLSLLLQPALIRLIDQLRTQLKEVNWTWTYETIEIWPKEVPQITRSQYEEMVRALEVASGEEAETIQD